MGITYGQVITALHLYKNKSKTAIILYHNKILYECVNINIFFKKLNNGAIVTTVMTMLQPKLNTRSDINVVDIYAIIFYNVQQHGGRHEND
ncbi:MAG: hypothetical protein N3F66_09735 [Spirochaetes bacterium]|nr:hypothetical protein [Spirochaetota bacterium]